MSKFGIICAKSFLCYSNNINTGIIFTLLMHKYRKRQLKLVALQSIFWKVWRVNLVLLWDDLQYSFMGFWVEWKPQICAHTLTPHHSLCVVQVVKYFLHSSRKRNGQTCLRMHHYAHTEAPVSPVLIFLGAVHETWLVLPRFSWPVSPVLQWLRAPVLGQTQRAAATRAHLCHQGNLYVAMGS